MASHQAAIIRAGYAALSKRDLETFLGLLTADAELHELPELPGTAVYRGRDEIRRWAEDAMKAWGEWQWIPEEFVHEDGDTVVVRTRMIARGDASDVPIEQRLFHLITIRDGKVHEMRGFLEQGPAVDAAVQRTGT